MDDAVTLSQMARKFPVRTGLFTVGPVVFALLQLANSYVHDVSLLFAGVLAVVMLGFSVLVTRYHLAVFRRTTVSPLGARKY